MTMTKRQWQWQRGKNSHNRERGFSMLDLSSNNMDNCFNFKKKKKKDFAKSHAGKRQMQYRLCHQMAVWLWPSHFPSQIRVAETCWKWELRMQTWEQRTTSAVCILVSHIDWLPAERHLLHKIPRWGFSLSMNNILNSPFFTWFLFKSALCLCAFCLFVRWTSRLLYLGLHHSPHLGKTEQLDRLDCLHTLAQQTGKGLEAQRGH